MTNLIAQFIDSGILILAAVLLLRYYFKPESKFHRKKWVLAGCVLMILYSVIEFGMTYHKHAASRLPSRESVEKTIQNSGKTVTKDFKFSSKDGYQILIPSGYKYILSQSGGLSLTATKDYSVFLVVKMQDPAGLDTIMNNVLVALQKKNPVFKLNDRRKISINESEAVRVDCSITRNDVSARVITVLFRKSNNLFQLTFSCPQELFEGLKAEYWKILKSFKIN
ncbi:MAG: hypothetical protein PHR77_19505 [Kiritimatiellae bacterium]|nr:hypothetical protein [Kiritimatiellia bacterium]MDD5520147.1 hypothetical protein [Kiritimatiellia bacterium]